MTGAIIPINRSSKDLSGQKFGRWLVKERANQTSRTEYLCICDCGTERVVLARSLKAGRSRSCGCTGRSTTHGHTRGGRRSLSYRSWESMQERCLNPNNDNYPRYGGRNIRIEPRWLGPTGFATFLSDLGERPPGTTLDRIDVNGNYEVSNCRWASPAIQGRNTRTVKLKAEDVQIIKQSLSEGVSQIRIAKQFGVSYQTICDIAHQRTWFDAPIKPRRAA